MRSTVPSWRDWFANRLPRRPLITAPSSPTRGATTRTGRRSTGSARSIGWPALMVVLSLGLLLSTAGLDGFLHRGIVYGAPATSTGGLVLGMNTFLEKEVNPDNVAASVRMLKEANVTFVRQSFPWAEIEPEPGVYRDPKNGQESWAKYDRIVNALNSAGIGILARIDTIPRWARPPTDDFAHWDKGPPQDFNNYANFVGTLAARYRGKIGHFQVWNEPNLTGEWGGKPISPQQYGLLLKLTSERVKSVNPAALIVTAGLAQTNEDGVRTNNLSELAFVQGLYDAGAQHYFDILSVMGYGIGDSPEDRRVSPTRTNFSRLLLVRDIMVRNGDAAKSIWVSEYGWIALPPDWKGPYNNYWGASVDEDTQARWTIAGLERARREWPWLGAVFVWAFRWVEAPEERPDDPARFFEVVDYNFTPRPTYVALKQWSAAQAIAGSGVVPIRDARLDWRGGWRDQQLAGRDYRVASGPGAAVRLVFHGTDLRVQARTGPNRGRVYVTIDGRAAPDLDTDESGAYVSLRNTQVVDKQLPIVAGLADGDHTLELRASETGEVALGGLVIGRRAPFAWPGPILFALGLAGLFAGLFLIGRALLVMLGWLPEGALRRGHTRPEWWDTRE